MANFCLIPSKVNDFRQALKNKDLNIVDLMNMTSEQRTAALTPYAGENAKNVNTLFEEKLILKNKMQGLKNWASKIGEIGRYSPEGKTAIAQAQSEYRAAQQQRIFSPQEHEAFLNNLADKIVGTHISPEVAAKVFELSQKAESLKNVNPGMSGVSDAYLKAKGELNSFVAAQKPTSVISSVVKNLMVIGRNNLLMNPSTPLKTTIGQTINSAMDFISRRLGARALTGKNSAITSQANKEAWATFRKTGLNTAAMEGMDDTTHMMGKGENFKTPTGTASTNPFMHAIEATVRNVAKVSNKVIIDYGHVYAFTKFYQKAFFDMVNLSSPNAEVAKDAVRIEPQTDQGAMVRLQAQQQAARITSTNENLLSRFALQAKNTLNKYAGFPLGDFLIPIAKIPAAIIYNGIDNAGAGIPKGLKDVFQGRQKMQSFDPETKYQGSAQFASGLQRLMRIGGTIGVAALIASHFKKEDFRTDPIYGTHFVRIGNTWINTEYISAISPALAGFMGIKQKGDTGLVGNAETYVTSGLVSLKTTPGIDEYKKLVDSMTNSDVTKGIQKYMKDFFTSRGEPAFLKNLKNINHLFFGATGVQSDQAYQQGLKDKAAAASAKAKASAKATKALPLDVRNAQRAAKGLPPIKPPKTGRLTRPHR